MNPTPTIKSINFRITLIIVAAAVGAIIILFQPCNKPIKHQDEIKDLQKSYDSLKVKEKKANDSIIKLTAKVNVLTDSISIMEVQKGRREIALNAAAAHANILARQILEARKTNDTSKYIANCDSIAEAAAQEWITTSRMYTETIDSLIHALKDRDSVKNDLLAQRADLNIAMRGQVDNCMNELITVNSDYKKLNRRLTRAKGVQRLEAALVLIAIGFIISKK